MPRAHRPARRHDPARRDLQHRRPLVDRHAGPPDRIGQAAHQPRRVDRGAMRRVRAAQHPGRASHRARRVCVEQPQVRSRRSRTRAPPRPRPSPAPAEPASARASPCRPWPSGSRCPPRPRPGRPRRRSRAWRAASRRPRRARPSGPVCRSDAGNRAEHQPPFRPDAPNPAISRSQTDDPQRGFALRQVVGGPQAGEARPDDGDVGLRVAGQRVAWPRACRARCRARTTRTGTDQIGPCGTSWQATAPPGNRAC